MSAFDKIKTGLEEAIAYEQGQIEADVVTMERLEYKGYSGSIEYSDGVLHGKVLGVKSLISYEGHSAEELREDFERAVDDYLELCKESGITPEKSY